ncbi:MAG: EamA family transporter [Bacteroidota bacterium]|nr:EamA family transporter [Bacteroidota bacterium]
MQPWMIYILLSTLTGGAALVFSKMGMRQANEHAALVIRTGILFLIVLVNAVMAGGLKDFKSVPQKALTWFILAGISTAVYWIFFFKAMKTANLTILSSIDKGSILITFLLSYIILNEPITPKVLIGAALIISGTFVLMR